MSWSRLLYLLNDRRPWVDLVDNSKEACEFSPMSWENLKLFYKVVTSLRRHESQFVYIATIALLGQL